MDRAKKSNEADVMQHSQSYASFATHALARMRTAQLGDVVAQPMMPQIFTVCQKPLPHGRRC